MDNLLRPKPNAPTCPSCEKSRGLTVYLRGPIPDPLRRTEALFFVCDRCDFSMRDRRGATRRDTPGSGETA